MKNSFRLLTLLAILLSVLSPSAFARTVKHKKVTKTRISQKMNPLSKAKTAIKKSTMPVAKLVTTIKKVVAPARPVLPAPYEPVNTVVLDAGHNGNDPGARLFLLVGKNKKPVELTEASHAYDITSRVGQILQSAGKKVVYTVTDPRIGHKPQNDNLLPFFRSGIFDITGKLAVSTGAGLQTRTHTASIVKKYAGDPNTRFVAIHLDEAGVATSGGEVIYKAGSKRFASAIATEMKRENLGHTSGGSKNVALTLQNNSRDYSRCLHVLGGNSLSNSVLVECENLKSAKGRARIMSPQGRQRFAECIARGILDDEKLIAKFVPRQTQFRTDTMLAGN